MMRGCLALLGGLMGVVVVAVLAWFAAINYVAKAARGPDPVTIASASLQGLREQNRLSAFAARYVAVVTSTQSRLGLTARKTLIMPGDVRYEVDLGRLQQRDVRWDAGAKKLIVHLPPLETVGPQVDLTKVREYTDGGMLMQLTDAESRLDAANRREGQAELVRQAREETPMRLARDATRRAVERSFLMPLRAAGLDASVEATFPDERPGDSTEQWDRSRPISEVLGNAR